MQRRLRFRFNIPNLASSSPSTTADSVLPVSPSPPRSYGRLSPSKPPQSTRQFCSSVPGTITEDRQGCVFRPHSVSFFWFGNEKNLTHHRQYRMMMGADGCHPSYCCSGYRSWEVDPFFGQLAKVGSHNLAGARMIGDNHILVANLALVSLPAKERYILFPRWGGLEAGATLSDHFRIMWETEESCGDVFGAKRG
jgi:hypothetical protein